MTMKQFVDANVGGLMIGDKTGLNITKFPNDMDIVKKSTILICSQDIFEEYTNTSPLKREDLIGKVYLNDKPLIYTSPDTPCRLSIDVGCYDIYLDHERGNYFFMVFRGNN